MENPFSKLSDEELMVLYQKGEERAFEIIYSRHKDKVYSYLYKRVHHKDEINDLFQRVFTKFHKSRRLYNNRYDLLPWLYTITKSELLDFIKRPRKNSISFDEEAYSPRVEQPLQSSIDLDSEKSLNTNEKKALNLRYYSENEFKEIANILKTSESNARKIISRGIKKLRLKYSEEK